MEEIFATQQKHKNRSKIAKRGKPHRVLLIADDCINDKNARDKGIFNKIFTQGRHYFIDLFCLSQTLKGFAPMARKNCDITVCWRCLEYDDRDTIVEDYLMIEDGRKCDVKRGACALVSSVKYRCVVIERHLSTYAKSVKEYVRQYIANDNLKPKMIGTDRKGVNMHNEDFKFHQVKMQPAKTKRGKPKEVVKEVYQNFRFKAKRERRFVK